MNTPGRMTASHFQGGGLTPLPDRVEAPALQSRPSTGIPSVYASGMEAKDTESHFDGGSMLLSERAPGGCSCDGVFDSAGQKGLRSSHFDGGSLGMSPAPRERRELQRRASTGLPLVYTHFKGAPDDSADHFDGSSLIVTADQNPTAPLTSEDISAWKGTLKTASEIKTAGESSDVISLATRKWEQDRAHQGGLGGRAWRASVDSRGGQFAGARR
tara:strand:+ start:445 stop:1089 length:645 start_codon:yes stop_codon:yes gene_type:complete